MNKSTLFRKNHTPTLTPPHGSSAARLWRLCLKELRETLRDRRTVVTLVIMPLIVYPLLSIAFQRFLLSNVQPAEDFVHRIGVESNQDAETVIRYLERGEALLAERRPIQRPTEPPRAHADSRRQSAAKAYSDAVSRPPHSDFNIRVEADLRRAVAELQVDLGIRILKFEQPELPSGEPTALDCELLYLNQSLRGKGALELVERRLRAVNEDSVQQRLQKLGWNRRAFPVEYAPTPLQPTGAMAAYSLSALVPLILILMTITGAVYPAIDLTAGERERGTLEMLVAAPVPRMGLLLAKYITVLFVALLTATVNLIAMTTTVLVVGLGPLLFGEAGLSGRIVMLVFGLMILFAAFFSAALLAITSFARSFKEAQAYLIPLMLLAIAPGLLSMIPGVELRGWLVVTPLVNIVLLARDLFEHTADPVTAAVVVLSTALFALAAITVAGRVFGTDAILYGSPGTWSDLFRRPHQPRTAPTLTSVMMLLALMFPAYFVTGNLLARLQHVHLAARLIAAATITALLFVVAPLAASVINRVSARAAFRLTRPSAAMLSASVLLGCSLWPFAYELVLAASRLGFTTLGAEHFEQADALLADFRTISPLWIVLSLAVAPALCEEFFFRGYLLSALRRPMTAANAVLLSGVLFGLFHLLVTDQLAVERFLPSTLLGIVLALVCVRSGSVFPGMLLHACHNSLLLLASYYADDLALAGFGGEEQSHLPLSWLAAAALGTLAGLFLLSMSNRNTAQPGLSSGVTAHRVGEESSEPRP